MSAHSILQLPRPTFLDLAKASIPLGVKGKISCPNCGHFWEWRLEYDGQSHEEPLTQSEIRAEERGFISRLMQEICQHFAKDHV